MVQVRKPKIQPDAKLCKCKKQCYLLLSPNERIKLREHYNQLAYGDQFKFIASLIRFEPIRYRNPMRTGKYKERHVTAKYSLPGLSEHVCRKTFLNVFGFSSSKLQETARRLDEGDLVDHRGIHWRLKALKKMNQKRKEEGNVKESEGPGSTLIIKEEIFSDSDEEVAENGVKEIKKVTKMKKKRAKEIKDTLDSGEIKSFKNSLEKTAENEEVFQQESPKKEHDLEGHVKEVHKKGLKNFLDEIEARLLNSNEFIQEKEKKTRENYDVYEEEEQKKSTKIEPDSSDIQHPPETEISSFEEDFPRKKKKRKKCEQDDSIKEEHSSRKEKTQNIQKNDGGTYEMEHTFNGEVELKPTKKKKKKGKKEYLRTEKLEEHENYKTGHILETESELIPRKKKKKEKEDYLQEDKPERQENQEIELILEAEGEPLPRKKKKRKKDHTTDKPEEQEQEMQEIEQILEVEGQQTPRKKKKRKEGDLQVDNQEWQENHIEVEGELIPRKKKKKRKKERNDYSEVNQPEEQEMQEIEQILEVEGQHTPRKKKKRKEGDLQVVNQEKHVEVEGELILRKKKKKKKEKQDNLQTNQPEGEKNQEIKLILEAEGEPLPKKKKKRKKDYLQEDKPEEQENYRTEPNLVVEGELIPRKKKKKKKEREYLQEDNQEGLGNQAIEPILEARDESISRKKEKKKKDYLLDTPEREKNHVIEPTVEEGGASPRKKAKKRKEDNYPVDKLEGKENHEIEPIFEVEGEQMPRKKKKKSKKTRGD